MIRRESSLKEDVVEAMTEAISESDFSPARCCLNALAIRNLYGEIPLEFVI